MDLRIPPAQITGYFSLYDVPLPWLRYFDLCQRKNVYAPQAFSEMPGLPDVLQQHAIPHRIFDWTISEEEAFAGLAAEIRDGNSRVLFFYRPDLDGLMHTVGPRDRRVKEKLDDYSRRIGEMIDTARARHREVEVYVFGDHGMAEVEHTHDVWAALRGLPFAVPGDYLYFLDSTMARFWFRHDEARRSVRRVLAELPYGRILETRELEDLNAFFPQQDYGEMIFLVEEGHLLVPSFMGLTPVRGMHGYHPLAAASYTTLVTNQELAHYPRNLFELHDVLRAAFERAAA
ncbi:MAG: alkaline phosphatase family protein [Candidatus Eisenbacteria bacterium]